MDSFVQQIESLVANPGALFGLMFFVALANVFFPPVPAEAATVFAGYLSGVSSVSLVVVLPGVVGGMVIGSVLLYGLARRFGIATVERTPGLRNALSKRLVARAELWICKYGVWTLFLGKIVPGMSLCTVICCGAFKLGARKAIPAILLSNLLFFTLLAMAGRVLGENWRSVEPWLGRWGLILLLGLAAGVLVAFVLVRRSRRRREPDR